MMIWHFHRFYRHGKIHHFVFTGKDHGRRSRMGMGMDWRRHNGKGSKIGKLWDGGRGTTGLGLGMDECGTDHAHFGINLKVAVAVGEQAMLLLFDKRVRHGVEQIRLGRSCWPEAEQVIAAAQALLLLLFVQKVKIAFGGCSPVAPAALRRRPAIQFNTTKSVRIHRPRTIGNNNSTSYPLLGGGYSAMS